MRIGLLLRIASLAIVAAVTSANTPAQTEEIFNRESLREAGSLSREQQFALQTRRQLIVNEASSSPANEWAGTYVATDSPTSGAQLDWAPDNGFVVGWNSCSHGWRDRINLGKADFRDGVLRVTPELGSEGGKVYALAGELIPVKWGEQHYLVPLDQLIAFCYAARNAGRSLEIDEFFLKQSDRDKRRFGLPKVPVEYRKYLVGPPVQATIVELNPQSGRNVFTLNRGRSAGVVPGMKFFFASLRNVYMLVEVSAVSDDTSEAYVITSGLKSQTGKAVKPRVGWKLTSRAPRKAYQYFPG